MSHSDEYGTMCTTPVGKRKPRSALMGCRARVHSNHSAKTILPSFRATPFLNVNFRHVGAKSLLDSGASCNFISRALVNTLKQNHVPLKLRVQQLRSVMPDSTLLESRECTTLSCKIGGFTWKHIFHVVDNLVVDVILGASFMEHSGMILDFCGKCVSFKFNRDLRFPFVSDVYFPVLGLCSGLGVEGASGNEQLLEDLKVEFWDVLTHTLGCVREEVCHIDLVDDVPVRSPPYQCTPPKLKALRGIIDDLLKQGVITPSRSAYASPAFLVPKGRANDFRLVVNYQKLNAKVVYDSYPIPSIENAFSHFHGATVFSVLDLNQGYFQLPLSNASAKATAFITPFGLYQPNRLPMGLCVGGQLLSRVLDRILGDLKYIYVYTYIDDVLVFSRTLSEHLGHLREVFSRLRKAGLTINPDKVCLGVSEIKFLGHLVSGSGIRVNPERVQGILDCPAPKDLKGVRSFLGMAGYFSRHIPNYSELAAPLNDLKKKGVTFHWGPEQQQSYLGLKKTLSEAPVLHIPDFGKPFLLYTDASDIALAAVLKQRVGDGLKPVAFASRVLSPAEKVYSIYERECLAVLFGCERFKSFLEHQEFTVFTDNEALTWMRKHVNQLGRVGRWILRLAQFKFNVVHVRGADNQVADCLTRLFDVDKSNGSVVGTVLTTMPASFTSIRDHQQQDPLCKGIYDKLVQGTPVVDHKLSHELVMVKTGKQGRYRVLLPTTLVVMILKYYHDSVMGGHLGQLKTYHKVARQFYWKGMRRDIQAYVRRCVLCQRSKPATTQKTGFFSSHISRFPCDAYFIDFFGPLVRSKQGNTAILSIVDGFSKFVWLFPIRRMTAKAVCNMLCERVMPGYGVPRSLVSDNGAQFRSSLFRDMCFQWGIKHIRTSAYNPNPNLVERVHRNLKMALQIYHHMHQASWDTNLQLLTMAFNSGVHESTKTTAAKLFLGREMAHPLEVQWDLGPAMGADCSTEDLQVIWERALKSLKQAQATVARRYNAGRIAVPFKVGDSVLVRLFPQSSVARGFTSKLAQHWSKPLTVASFTSPVSVRLLDPVTGRVCRTAHVRHLKAFVP